MKDATLTPGAMGGGLAVPAGAYPNSENTRYDGHYVLDNDLPPRPGRDGDGGEIAERDSNRDREKRERREREGVAEIARDRER